MKVEYDTYRNDLEEARRKYRKNKNVKIISIEFETDELTFINRMSVAKAKELIEELSDYVRWIKEEEPNA